MSAERTPRSTPVVHLDAFRRRREIREAGRALPSSGPLVRCADCGKVEPSNFGPCECGSYTATYVEAS